MHTLYSNELSKEMPKMPRKLRPVMIPNEPQNELEIRERLARQKMKHETELLLLISQKFKQNFENIDDTMQTIFSKELPISVANDYIINWKKDCEIEEQKSQFIFKKKKLWIENNLTNELHVKVRKKNNISNKENTNDDISVLYRTKKTLMMILKSRKNPDGVEIVKID